MVRLLFLLQENVHGFPNTDFGSGIFKFSSTRVYKCPFLFPCQHVRRPLISKTDIKIDGIGSGLWPSLTLENVVFR